MTWRISGWWFSRGLGIIYFIAFLSWWVQFDALTGSQGLSPVPAYLAAVQEAAVLEGWQPFWRVPTLYWWYYSDAFASGLCLMGAGLSLLVVIGVLQGPLLLTLWFAYLSIVTTGDVFMSYQWDALLLEAGLLAALVAPWRWWTSLAASGPRRWAMWLPQLLVIKLMFLSGIVKLTSGDEAWRDLTALAYHYETQPLPAPLAWWVHHWPMWAHQASCAVMFFIELILPVVTLLVLLLEVICRKAWRWSRWVRGITAWSFVLLMAVVASTGNYTYFNLLTALLAVTLLDDAAWPSWLRRWFGEAAAIARTSALWRRSVHGISVGALLILSLWVVIERQVMAPSQPSAVTKAIAPFASVNTYGLFAVMTKERHEIVLEVSDDGIFWLPLEFRWKPGRENKALPLVAPHQPRLDWQIWFAALYPGYDPAGPQYAGMRWFGALLEAIVQNRTVVTDLLEPPPMPWSEVHYIRASFYRYRFSDAAGKAQGDWWAKEYLGTFTPRQGKPQP